jgi:hypothetical protein
LLRFAHTSILAVFCFTAGLIPASAQWNDPPQPAPTASPWNAPAQQGPAAASPWSGGAPPQQQQQQQACVEKFGVLRDDAQKKAGAIQAASKNKVDPKTACGLFNNFSAAEAKLVKYAADNVSACGIPPEIINNLKAQHQKTIGIQTRVCQVAANPPRPAGPSLSDVLGGTAVPDANNIRTGRGTYDTLTGTPLGKQ